MGGVAGSGTAGAAGAGGSAGAGGAGGAAGGGAGATGSGAGGAAGGGAGATGASGAGGSAGGNAGGASGAGGSTGGSAGAACPQPDADGDGYRSVACGGDDCNDQDPAINRFAADDWTVEVVEHKTFTGVGYGLLATSMGVTSKGAIHLVRRVDAELVAFTNETGAWVSTSVAADPSIGAPAMAVDPKTDDVYVAFIDSATRVAKRASATAWTVSMIDADPGYPGLVVDGNGALHAAYTAAGELRLASTATGPWTHVVLPTIVDGGLSPAFYRQSSLAIDTLGATHVAYEQHYGTGRIPSRTVETVSNATGTWVAANVGKGENVTQLITPATGGGFHGAGVVELGLGRETTLIYFGKAAALLPKTVQAKFSTTPAIAVAGGRVQIAHAGGETVNFVPHAGLRIASAPEEGAATWTFDTVEVVGTASAPSVVVDSAGAIHVAYLVQIDANGTFELRHAHRAAPDGVDQDCDGHPG
jgi:hypothetical protein